MLYIQPNCVMSHLYSNNALVRYYSCTGLVINKKILKNVNKIAYKYIYMFIVYRHVGRRDYWNTLFESNYIQNVT